MTVPNTTCKNLYPGTGSQSVFPYTFRIVQASDLLVQKIDANGIPTTLALTTDYTVSGAQNDTGGNITLSVALPVGYTLVILNDPSPLQGLALSDGGQFSAVAIMRAMDLLTRQSQAMRDRTLRSPRVPSNEAPSENDLILPMATLRAVQVASYDAAGRPTVGIPDNYVGELKLSPEVRDKLNRGGSGGGGGGGGGAGISVKDFGAKGDGVTDDTAAIQEAINTANGLISVFIPAGVYLVTDTLEVGIAGTVIYGEGEGCSQLLTNAGSFLAPVIRLDADDCTLRWIEIASPPLNHRIGVVVNGVARCSIFQCVFTGGTSTGVFIYALSTDTKVTGNKLLNQWQAGIATGGTAADNHGNGHVERTVITGNFISGCGDEGIDVNWDTQDCLIFANTIIDCGDSGNEAIDIGGGTSPNNCKDVVVSNNIIKFITKLAMCVDVKIESENVTVVDNLFIADFVATDSSTPAIWVNGTTVKKVSIRGNLISGFGRSIYISGGAKYVKVQDNILTGAYGHSLLIANSATGYVDVDNNNFMTLAAATHEEVLNVVNGIYISIKGNRFDNKGSKGCVIFRVTATGPSFVQGNIITGGSYGVGVDTNGKNVSITGNLITRQTGRGIYLVGGNKEINITNNSFHEWSVSGNWPAIEHNGGDGFSCIDNAFFDTASDGAPVAYDGIKFSAPVTSVVVGGNRFGSTLRGLAFVGLARATGAVYANYDGKGAQIVSTDYVKSGYTISTPALLGRTDAGAGPAVELIPDSVRSFIGSPWLVSAPASPTSPGITGQIAYDSSHFYVCTATNVWVRADIATWTATPNRTLDRAGGHILTRSGAFLGYR